MYVFIDEAGPFLIPPASKPNVISSVAAVVIPDPMLVGLFRRFRRLTRSWRDERGEIKGSKLDEVQVATILKALRRDDVLVFAACIDMGLHTKAGIAKHKEQQALLIDRAAQGDHPNRRPYWEETAAGLRRMSLQLYVQAVLMTEVMAQVLNDSWLYYQQRVPSTLRTFVCRIDAKNLSLTPAEDTWLKLVSSMLQTRSMHEPQPVLDDGDPSCPLALGGGGRAECP
jgi:hypothetical protein